MLLNGARGLSERTRVAPSAVLHLNIFHPFRSSLILERNLTRTSPHPEYVSPNHPVPISDSLSVRLLSEQNSGIFRVLDFYPPSH